MSFYDELSKVYDIVFPKDENTLNFLSSDLKPNSKIVDLACGTGTYAIALGDQGHTTTGLDLDEEVIKLANKKSKNENNKFLVQDMRKLKDIFENETVDMAFCIGNSLVHLDNLGEMEKFIKDTYEILNNNGMFVIQIINFDRIVKYKVNELPTIDKSNEGVKFVRKYRHAESKGKIYFETELIISKGSKTEIYNNSVPLMPLQSEQLIKMLENAGFERINIYGNFLGAAYEDTSYATVVKAYKK